MCERRPTVRAGPACARPAEWSPYSRSRLRELQTPSYTVLYGRGSSRVHHPGVLAAKVSDFGSNLLKCYSSRSAPNLLKAATWPLAPSNVLKCAPGGGDSQKGLHFTKRSSLHGRTRFAKVGPPRGRGSILLKSRRPLMSTTPPCPRGQADFEGFLVTTRGS